MTKINAVELEAMGCFAEAKRAYKHQYETANGHGFAAGALEGMLRCEAMLVRHAANEMFMVLQAAAVAIKGNQRLKHLHNDITAVLHTATEGK